MRNVSGQSSWTCRSAPWPDRCAARDVPAGPVLVVLARRGPGGRSLRFFDPLVAPSRWAGIAADRRPYAPATRSAGLHRPVPGGIGIADGALPERACAL